MKKISNAALAFTVLLSIGMSSCEKELLDQTNPNAITTNSFWQSKNDFDMAINALYSSLQFPSVSGSGLAFEMLRSDEAGTESWYGEFLQYSNMNWNDASNFVRDRWAQLYIGIYRANQILNYVDGAKFLSDQEKNLIKAQARFLRGLNYFWLINTYGKAIIHDELAIATEQMHKTLSTADEVRTKMIIPDLEFAYSNLPKTWTGKNTTGRFTWGAAASMLGKTYLFNKEWNKAAQYFKEVINEADKGLYKLVPNFMDNFTTEGEFNSESILEVAFSNNFKPGVSGNTVDDINGNPGGEATSLANAFASITGAGGFNTVLPTYWLQELFVSGDSIDVSNPINAGRRYSNRTFATIVVEFGDGDYYKAPLTTNLATGQKSKANFSFGQGSKVKKWTNWYKAESEDPATQARTGINFRHIRLADVYLMYAEAVLEGSGNVNEALTYIDKVRSRAGVITLQQYMNTNGGMIPKIDKAKFPNQLSQFEFVPVNKSTLLHHIRMVERPLELSFEGHRWVDLVRWGIVKNVFAERRAEEIKLVNILINPATGGMRYPKIYPLYLNERVRLDWIIPAANYNSAQHDYFPIPSIEIQSNKKL